METNQIIRWLGLLLIGGIIGALAVGSVVFYYFGGVQNLLSQPNSIIPFIGAGSSVILAIITAVYVILTWRLVSETKNAREQEVMPFLNLELEPYAIGVMGPKLENIGNGPALDVEATISLVPEGGSQTIRSKNIAPGDFAGSLEPGISTDSHEEYNQIVVEGTYSNIFGNQEPFRDTFDLDILSREDGAESIMGRDEYKRLLRNIQSSLQTISEEIEMDGIETLLKIQNRGAVLNAIREEGRMSVRDLSQKVGLTHFELASILPWLSELGAIEYDVGRDEIFREENLDVEIRLADSEDS